MADALQELGILSEDFDVRLDDLGNKINTQRAGVDPEAAVRADTGLTTLLRAVNTLTTKVGQAWEKIPGIVNDPHLNDRGKWERLNAELAEFDAGIEATDAVVTTEAEKFTAQYPDTKPAEPETLEDIARLRLKLDISRHGSPPIALDILCSALDEGDMALARYLSMELGRQVVRPSTQWQTPAFQGALSQLMRLGELASDTVAKRKAAAARDYLATLESQYRTAKAHVKAIRDLMARAAETGITPEIERERDGLFDLMRQFTSEYEQANA